MLGIDLALRQGPGLAPALRLFQRTDAAAWRSDAIAVAPGPSRREGPQTTNKYPGTVRLVSADITTDTNKQNTAAGRCPAKRRPPVLRFAKP